jgi:hypothetical protein
VHFATLLWQSRWPISGPQLLAQTAPIRGLRNGRFRSICDLTESLKNPDLTICYRGPL